MLGNRWLTTDDECDACNDRFGKDYENDLGRMTLPMRAMTRSRTKSGTAKLKPKADAGKSFIGGGPQFGALRLNMDFDDPSVSMSFGDARRMAIRVAAPSFRPARAAKALARIAWQALPRERRSAHEPLREWLNGDGIGTASFNEISAPSFRGLAVGLWERRSSSSLDVPRLVLAVGFTGRVLVWGSREWSTGICPPFLFPPLPHAEGAMPLPNAVQYRHCADEVVPARVQTHHLSYGRGFPATVDLDSPGRIDVPTAAGLVTLDVLVTRRSIQNQAEVGDDVMLHEIHSGELVGSLLVATEMGSDVFRIAYVRDPETSVGPTEKAATILAAVEQRAAFRIFTTRAGLMIEHPGESRVADDPMR
jgi:hypothetical protein